MGSWHATWNHYLHHGSPPVYSRDFAYANSERIVLNSGFDVSMPPIDNGCINATSASTFAQLLSGQTVNIFVGPKRKQWTLHQNLLCHHSPYFETEFRGHEVSRKAPASNNGASTLELLEDDPRGFELLVKWLYQGQLEDPTSIPSPDDKYEYAVACHKLYLLADKFSMSQLKNLAMDHYRIALYEARLVPDAQEINDIYRTSAPKSAFRRLMTSIAARQIMDPGVKERDAESYRCCFEASPDFAVEMVNAIRGMSGGGLLFADPTETLGCEWHDHDGEQPCVQAARLGERRNLLEDMRKSKDPSASQGGRDELEDAHPSQRQGAKTPMAELSTDRRTPRRCVSGSLQQPGQASLARRSINAAALKHYPPASRSAPSTPMKRGPANTDRTRSPFRRAQTNGTVNDNGNSNEHNLPFRLANKSQRNDPHATGKRLNGSANDGQMNGTCSRSTSNAGGPQKLTHVNGMVRQFNGANGVNGGQYEEPHAQFGANDSTPRKHPPKLKRKAPS